MSFNSKKQLAQFLAEDIGKRDITSALLSKKKISADIISRESAVIAGLKYAKEIFSLKGCKAKIITKDGSKIKPNQIIMRITGNADKILTCERTALNIIARMSGIATQTNKLVKKIPKKREIDNMFLSNFIINPHNEYNTKTNITLTPIIIRNFL